MSDVLRHDPIRLKTGVAEEEFERFVTGELFPYFRERFTGLTRVTIANLTGQSLLKDTTEPRKYLWETRWSGPAQAIEGASFEGVVMEDHRAAEKKALLRKLAGFGRRERARVFTERTA
jgi:hypothetical protein